MYQKLVNLLSALLCKGVLVHSYVLQMRVTLQVLVTECTGGELVKEKRKYKLSLLLPLLFKIVDLIHY